MEGVDNYFSFLRIPTRQPKPRSKGVTIVTDKSLAPQEARNLMDSYAEIIDYVKFADHPALVARHSGPWLKAKLDIYHANGIKVLPGGVIFEVAAMQNKVPLYMEKVKALGFDAVEISDDVIPLLEPETRLSYIALGQQLGLEVFTEVGKKGPVAPLVAEEVIPTALRDLKAGAKMVTVENSDLALLLSLGDLSPVQRFMDAVGIESTVLEIGPGGGWPTLAVKLIQTFGPDVNLENIDPERLRHIDGMRRGMDRADNFAFLSERGGLEG